MELPTKKEFLANSLEPVEHEDCSICYEPMTEPVRLPCKHEFCKECIIKWLNGRDVDKCPTCRQRLFVRPNEGPVNTVTPEQAAMLRVFRRRRRISAALEAAGLGAYNNYPHVQEPFSNALSPNTAIEWGHQNLQDLTPQAREMLVTNELIRRVPGAIKIHPRALGSSLIIMSRALVQMALDDNMPWSDADQTTWKEIALTIWQIAAPLKVERVDRKALFCSISAALIDKSCLAGDCKCPFFLENGGYLRDLHFLLYFTLDYRGSWQSRNTVHSLVQTKAILAPRHLPRTASLEALEIADRWAEVMYGAAK